MSIEAARSLALTDEEYHSIVATLTREPTPAELAMYAAMWSEHCSYKSSKKYLKTLPTTGPRIVMGPGENAGVVDIGDGLVIVFKLESHNHPSAVEPVQGAATGVGGIVRDIIATGARPIALLDPLRFGELDDIHQRHLLDGVVHGIGQYGNSIGVPTVGGEISFDPCYAGNPLVNVMCVGIAKRENIARAIATGVGNLAILYGAKTGRDGIGGVSVLASRPFDANEEAKRPSVQVGDPFSEKVVIEATLDLLDRGLLVGLQDLGGAGLCCAISETTSRGESGPLSFERSVGMEVDLDRVLVREQNMESFEILTSESQERMFAIVKPDDTDEVIAICEKWGVDAVILGRVTDSGRLIVTHNGEIVADLPPRSLADEAPIYDRPAQRPAWIDELNAASTKLPPPNDCGAVLLKLLSSPNICSKAWAFEQYDYLVQHNTLQAPGSDAAVIRIEGTSKAIAISTDGNNRFGQLDPKLGAMHVVAESARNVACSGAVPIAITNCLNFGNPERSDVMWQFARAVEGIGEACRVLDTPVTGGNVSFYNETDGVSIHPTPIIGMIGLIEDASKQVHIGFRNPGDVVVLLGDTFDELGGSEFAWTVHRHLGGTPPKIDLAAEKRLCDLIAKLAQSRMITSAHDCSAGGLGVAVAESVIAGKMGASIELPKNLPAHVGLFSESASRAIITCSPSSLDAVHSLAKSSGVPTAKIGSVGGSSLIIDDLELSIDQLRNAYAQALPTTMGSET
ncbi:MAG: phosphoribosylformylglycinamidine synthase subunit PurL [Actinomycetota bacterium]